MSATRVGALIVIVCFCVPLFVGLGRVDLRGDEAAHSFSVDRILETGRWLIPEASPRENEPFLEKPPLKFWIVALPIRLGLLPHDEFGLRFWDALFGSLAFLYVYAIGARLAGPVCGASAAFILFALYPLVFDHGLRSNNMEAALLLCYCGGIFHFMAACDTRRRSSHAVAVGAFFALGFLTKFVAALFLPFVLAIAALGSAEFRAAVHARTGAWLTSAAVAFALITPWFAYATERFGQGLWRVMLGQQLIERMTTALDPGHIQPWTFYWTTLYKTFLYSGVVPLVCAGVIVLAIQGLRRQWADALLVVAWGLIPLVIISFGTSKLIHYMYPFVPAFALAGGYLVALIVMLAPAPLERIPLPRLTLAVLGLLLAALAVATAATGELRWTLAATTAFRNASVFRPAAASLAAVLLALGTRRSIKLAVAAFAMFLLPAPAYAQNIMRLAEHASPLHDTRDCLQRVATDAGGSRGLYVDVPDAAMQHHTYYYFRRLSPWTRADSARPVDLPAVERAIARPEPLLLSDARFRALVAAWHASPDSASRDFPAVLHLEDAMLVLPGPYAVCR